MIFARVYFNNLIILEESWIAPKTFSLFKQRGCALLEKFYFQYQSSVKIHHMKVDDKI